MEREKEGERQKEGGRDGERKGGVRDREKEGEREREKEGGEGVCVCEYLMGLLILYGESLKDTDSLPRELVETRPQSHPQSRTLVFSLRCIELTVGDGGVA